MQTFHQFDQPTWQKILLMSSLAHTLDLCGWIQFDVARQEKLEPIHLALLRRALLQKKVGFGTLQKETALPLYAISRAARRLHDRELVKLHFEAADKRRRYVRITNLGAVCMLRIERQIALVVANRAGVISNDSKRYYNFTLHLWNATRFFSPSQVTFPGAYFPSDIQLTEKIRPEQQEMLRFQADLQDPDFLLSLAPWAEQPDTE